MSLDLANVDPNVDGLVVSLDAKKAFDSVDYRYIKKCLTAFGLRCFIPVFEILYKDLSSKILINGNAVSGYSILKGVKQGCILFIMCMEPLLRNLKSNILIEPIASLKLPIDIPKSYGYADDVSILMKREERGVLAIFDEYEIFSKASGSIFNADKTELLSFNSQHQPVNDLDISYLGINHRLRVGDRIKINGIWFLQDSNLREEVNVARVLESTERLLRAWSLRRLTLLGRILIIKPFTSCKQCP